MTEFTSDDGEIVQKITAYPEQQELFNRVLSVCYEYAGKVSLAAVLGVLDLVCDELKLGESE